MYTVQTCRMSIFAMYELFIQRAKEGCQLCEKSEPEHSTFVEALHCQVRATARRLLKVQQSSKTPRPTFYSPHKTWTMASRYDPGTCSSYRLLPFPKCWTTVFFKDFDVAKMILAPEVWWEAVAPWRRNRATLGIS